MFPTDDKERSLPYAREVDYAIGKEINGFMAFFFYLPRFKADEVDAMNPVRYGAELETFWVSHH